MEAKRYLGDAVYVEIVNKMGVPMFRITTEDGPGGEARPSNLIWLELGVAQNLVDFTKQAQEALPRGLVTLRYTDS